MKSVMSAQKRFSTNPSVSIKRSSFNRSHGYKTTFDSGYLVPVFVDEVLPGDTFNLNANMFGRLATPIVPFMDNVFLETFFFFVPNRLLWTNWERFNGAQDNPSDSTDYLVPTLTSPSQDGYAVGSLFDYFGIPTDVPDLEHSALFSRAYNLIWNEWFRDENLQDSVVVDLDDGPDDPADYVLLRRGKRHDYFTSALPWPQKGVAVDLPLGTSAPVTGDHSQQDNYFSAIPSGGGRSFGQLQASQSTTLPVARFNGQSGSTPFDFTIGTPFRLELNDINLTADLSNATAATINSLREAFQLQALFERDARGGTRYIEIIQSHFGVISPDARLQRPEYLGGGRDIVNINSVAQTSSTDDTTPQGNLAAFGTVTASGHRFSKSFVEHGVVLGLVNVRADLTYQQGLNRMWSRQTRFDFFWPALARLGEQAILNKEIYAQGTSADDDVFGYQERWAEYRHKPSLITGQFRSTYTESLDVWHLSQEFESLPSLNSSFIEDNPPLQRVIATENEPEFLLDCYFHFICHRPMPVFSVPYSLGRF